MFCYDFDFGSRSRVSSLYSSIKRILRSKAKPLIHHFFTYILARYQHKVLFRNKLVIFVHNWNFWREVLVRVKNVIRLSAFSSSFKMYKFEYENREKSDISGIQGYFCIHKKTPRTNGKSKQKRYLLGSKSF